MKVNGVLNKQTLLPLGFVLLIVAGVLLVNNRLMRIEFRLTSIEDSMRRQMDDRWRTADMKSWALLLEAKNPLLDIPEPTAVTKKE